MKPKIQTAHRVSAGTETSAFLQVGCCHVNRHHQVFNQGGCLKSGVDYTLLPLGSRRMTHCVLVIFPVRGPSEQVDRAITAGTQHICEALRQLIIHTPPRSSVYQGLSQTRPVLLSHRKHTGGFLKSATHSLESSCVITSIVHMQSCTRTQTCTLDSAFCFTLCHRRSIDYSLLIIPTHWVLSLIHSDEDIIT